MDFGAVREHYTTEDVVSRILAALRSVNGPGVPILPDTLAPIDHFHGKGVIATEELAAMLQPQANDHLLDIGCGIGGPARWMAAKFGCRVTGVDLTESFCAAARELNSLTGLADRVNILHGSALALPVPDAGFDRAYSQAVLMNISDKLGFLREALRALRPGGLLALSFVGAGPAGEPYYPLPWAVTAATSFLVTPDEIRADLLTAGFQIVTLRDTSEEVAAALAPVLRQLETDGLPPLGEHVVTGENAKEWRINSMRSLRDRHTSMIEALAHKPA
ncbi:MAG: class I SAM-dependent methyltransferase [Alphaproteobacteria bacterium]|nr:class I SAM-dependent methyltransferase [Alphaproteobacteria bacterium]